jgi:hypothetical protein
MPAGDILKGKDLRIKMADNTIYHATECSFSTTREIESIATKDTDGNKGTPGNYEWSLSTSALVANKAGGSSQNDTKSILDAYIAGEIVAVEFTTDVEGDIILSGNAYLASCNITAAVGSSATYDVSFTGDGDLTVAAVPGA